MTRVTATRAWIAVHATGKAATLIVFSGIAAWFFGSDTLKTLGPIWLPAPVPVLLLVPLVAGTGAAIACVNTARPALPDPLRAKGFRLAWVVGWTGLAALVTSGASTDTSWMIVTRNVVLYTGLSLVVVLLGAQSLAPLPSFAYTIACMLFGYPPHEQRYYWWAFIMDSNLASSQLAILATLFVAAALAYVALPNLNRSTD